MNRFAKLKFLKLTFLVERGENSDRWLFPVAVSRCAARIKNYELKAGGREEIVMNSGASEHIVCDLLMLSEVRQVPSVYVELPNGYSIKSKEQRSLPLRIKPKKTMLGSVYYLS